MEAFVIISFLTYLLWAPLLTVGVLVYSIKGFKPEPRSVLRGLLHIVFLTVVAGPVGMIDGPLPGYMAWWAGDLGRHQTMVNYVPHYAAVVVLVLLVGQVIRASKQDPNDSKH